MLKRENICVVKTLSLGSSSPFPRPPQNGGPAAALSAHGACRACQVCLSMGEWKVNQGDRPRDRSQCLHGQQVDQKVEKGGQCGHTPAPWQTMLLQILGCRGPGAVAFVLL